ncbi:MAG: hypothetical protein KDE33_07315 [Bacteroidetes bacterium]|nr:hypothetical protein [Bacteroidota bacterium]
MNDSRRGIFIMSLNSNKLKEAVEHKNAFEFNHEVDQLDVFVFDTMEILNGIFLHEKNVMQQEQEIEEIISKLKTDFVAVNTSKRELIRCSTKRKELNPYLQVVYGEYFSNPIFERHCKNQVFQNLQPKLKRLAIDNNKSKLIEILIPFLLTEIAVFLFIYDGNEYQSIYGLETEMNIITAIRNNKYEAFNKYLQNQINYKRITVN